jgi:hypothetical protein
MLNAVARNTKRPLAMRWLASDDLEELGEALDDIAVGVDVATAFTPPVTGPVSDCYVIG